MEMTTGAPPDGAAGLNRWRVERVSRHDRLSLWVPGLWTGTCLTVIWNGIDGTLDPP